MNYERIVSTEPELQKGFCVNINKYGSISAWILVFSLLLSQKKAEERSLRVTTYYILFKQSDKEYN